MARWTFAAGALLAGLLAPMEARGDPLPLRIDYQAAPACPGEQGFLDEIRWRTPLARPARAGEDALLVRARITRRGSIHEGRISIGVGRSRVDREIHGAICDEVVSALALVTALAVDPRASTARRRPAPAPPPVPPPPSPPVLPGEAPPDAPPDPAARLPPPEILAPPLPVVPAPAPPPDRPVPSPWLAGAGASAAFAVTPRPLLGGSVFVERGFSLGGFGAALRLEAEVGATGAFDAGPGRVSFLRGAGRISGCAFSWAPAGWMSLMPCVAAEAGVLHGQGVAGGSITRLEQATVPWAAVSILPRATFAFGPVVVHVQGGPVFPLVRRTFVFHDPTYVVHDLPPVTGTAGLGVGVRFP